MSLPTMNGTARLMDDPQLRYAASGSAVVTVRLAFNSRKKDPQTGEWKDDASFFVDGKAFGQAAENIAETLTRGLEAVVSGRLKTESWETKQGEKRSGTSLLIDSIGPSLRSATAKVTKASSSGGGSGRQQYERARQASSQEGMDDPWTSGAAPAGQSSGAWGAGAGYSDQPPF
jgi:single-strand DNA-binding protein